MSDIKGIVCGQHAAYWICLTTSMNRAGHTVSFGDRSNNAGDQVVKFMGVCVKSVGLFNGGVAGTCRMGGRRDVG